MTEQRKVTWRCSRIRDYIKRNISLRIMGLTVRPTCPWSTEMTCSTWSPKPMQLKKLERWCDTVRPRGNLEGEEWVRGFGWWYLNEIPRWLHSGSLLRNWFGNRLKCLEWNPGNGEPLLTVSIHSALSVNENPTTHSISMALGAQWFSGSLILVYQKIVPSLVFSPRWLP
jgi:hypothetical protein